ncbi:hypothetical protein DPSP01_001495 [Paraphaeosphaeria sporulosa]
MDTAVATEPIPKKRGRPRKVVSEDAPAVEPKTGVRKASTKTAAAEKKEAAPKKVAKATKTATKTTTKTTTKAALAKATKATKAAAPSKTAPAPQTSAAPKAPAPTKAASTPDAEEHIVETPQVADKPTPVTPSTSKILEQVYKTGTVKPPPPASPAPAAQEILLPTGGAANVVIEQPAPAAAMKPSLPSEPIQPTPTPTYTPPTSSSAPPPPPPPPPPPQHSIPISRPTPTSALRKATTIPLPLHPLNPSKPATPRPKPISPADLEKAAIERDINEGRMPRKYQGAARRVTAIMVGIPVILVVGWDLYKRWDGEVRKKFGEERVAGP